MAMFDLKNATLLLRGGTLGQFIAVLIGNGNITYDEKRPIEYIKDRGLLQTVRLGDEDPMDVKFEFEWIHITAVSGDMVPTIEDALKQRGPASTWLSSDADACTPYAVDVVIKYLPCVADTPETTILPDFRYEGLNHDAKTGMISCTGKCNAIEATSTRGALQSY